MGNTCCSVSSTEPVQFTLVDLFPKNNNQLDLIKMKLVTRIINAQNNWTKNFSLKESKDRAIKWYRACAPQSNKDKDEITEVIRALRIVNVNTVDIEAYGHYMGYKVHLPAEDGADVEISIEPLNDLVI